MGNGKIHQVAQSQCARYPIIAIHLINLSGHTQRITDIF